jgi:hypothetical protein
MAAEAQIETVPKRRFFKWFCVSLAAACLLLANLPAQEVLRPDLKADGKYGPHFQCRKEGQHGWPLTFLWRRPVYVPGPPWSVRWSIWSLTDGVTDCSLLALAIDLAIAAGVLAIVAFAADAWRKTHPSLTQLQLKELLVIVSLLAGASAWVHAARNEYLTEQRILQTIEAKQNWGASETWQRGGPTWLRNLIGDHAFEWFDRVVQIDLEGEAVPIDEASRLRSLRVLRLSAGSTILVADVAKLQRLHDLVALDLCSVCLRDPEPPADTDWTAENEAHSSDPAFERLSKVTSLQGINLYDGLISGTGLAKLSTLTNMRVLDLTDTDVDDEGLPAIGKMRKLQSLSLYSTKVTDAGMSHLARLSELEELWLSNTEVTDKGICHLEDLTRLRRLGLNWTKTTDRSLPVLAGLGRLEYLDLTKTEVTQQELPRCQISY